MAKLALLKKVSFAISNENILLYLADKVTFHEFNGTIEMMYKIHELLGGGMIEVLNCDYTEKYLTQAFYPENSRDDVHDNIVLIKREINEIDNYAYPTAKDIEDNGDPYIHVDVTFLDIENMLIKKTKHCGVEVCTNGDMNNITYTFDYDAESFRGTLKYVDENGTNYSKCFLNVPKLVNSHEKLSQEQFNEVMQIKVNEINPDYFYTQRDVGIGLLNCFCPTYGEDKNSIMEKIMSEQVYGNSIVGFENHLNDDSRILDLDSSLFAKLLKFLETPDFKQKNTSFCNVYYELKNM